MPNAYKLGDSAEDSGRYNVMQFICASDGARDGADTAGVSAGGENQFAATQTHERRLYSALRQARCIGDHTKTCRDWFPSLPRGLTVKIQINQISGRLLIVPDQIAHQHVEHVIVYGNGLFETRHNGTRMKKE